MAITYSLSDTQIPSLLKRLEALFPISFSTYTTVPFASRQYEVHQNAIDIQFVQSGVEEIYVLDAKRLPVALPFSREKDIGFFGNEPGQEPNADCVVHLKPGLFCVLFPGEAHKPCIQEGKPIEVEKGVAKVPYAAFSEDPLLFHRLFSFDQ